MYKTNCKPREKLHYQCLQLMFTLKNNIKIYLRLFSLYQKQLLMVI